MASACRRLRKRDTDVRAHDDERNDEIGRSSTGSREGINASLTALMSDVKSSPIVEETLRIGARGVDVVVGNGHQGGVVTPVERTLRLLLMRRVDGATVEECDGLQTGFVPRFGFQPCMKPGVGRQPRGHHDDVRRAARTRRDTCGSASCVMRELLPGE